MIKLIFNISYLLAMSGFGMTTYSQTTFIVESLPKNTPPEDSIFITGTFNDWAVNDIDCMLEKLPNGHLAVVLSLETDSTYEYKFTRGSWMKVETDESNDHTENRVIIATHKSIYSTIANWQDLGGVKQFPYIIFYYFAIAFQGIGLLLLVFRIRKKEYKVATWFYAFNAYLILMYLIVVFYHILSPIWQSYIMLVGQALIFCWGPFLYLMVASFNSIYVGKWWLHFIPFTVALAIAMLRFLNLDIAIGSFFLVGVGVLLSFFYAIVSFMKVDSSLFKIDQSSIKDNFVRLFLVLSVWAIFTASLHVYWVYVDYDMGALRTFDLTFISVSFLIILETYYIWRYPTLLRREKKNTSIYVSDKLVDHLTALMEEESIYKSQDLNISILSDHLGIKSHILSKVLNERYNQSFRDFVNSYRIKEFIRQAENGKLETYTYLGLAHEVGFNSKSTFNLAFKKHTNKSPSEFFKNSVAND